jgi:hypothetical protein
VIRTKVILLADEGLSNDIIASRLDTPDRQQVAERISLALMPGLEMRPRGRKAGFPSQASSARAQDA